MTTLDRMLVETARYPVLMSRTMYRWLVYDVLRPVMDRPATSWPHGGRVSYVRLETLHARTRQVEFQGEGGRTLRLTSKDARTVMGLVELHRSLGLTAPPASARSLVERLRWQVGDADHLPGVLPPMVRALRLIPLGDGKYLLKGPGPMPVLEGV